MKNESPKQKMIENITCFLYGIVGIALIIGMFMVESESNLQVRLLLDSVIRIYGIIGLILVVIFTFYKKRKF